VVQTKLRAKVAVHIAATRKASGFAGWHVPGSTGLLASAAECHVTTVSQASNLGHPCPFVASPQARGTARHSEGVSAVRVWPKEKLYDAFKAPGCGVARGESTDYDESTHNIDCSGFRSGSGAQITAVVTLFGADRHLSEFKHLKSYALRSFPVYAINFGRAQIAWRLHWDRPRQDVLCPLPQLDRLLHNHQLGLCLNTDLLFLK